jgi:transcription initiation factor TFIID subunit 8
LTEEKDREKEEERPRAREEAEENDWNVPLETRLRQPTVDRNVNLDEGVHVNYEQRFWRKSARGV